MQKVMVVAETEKLAERLAAHVEDAVYRVETRALTDGDWAEPGTDGQADLLVIHTTTTTTQLVARIAHANGARARPVAMFTDDGNRERMADSLRAGVTAYVVNGLEAARVRPVMDLAVARFEEMENLRKELLDARSDLEARKLVERAKGLIMRQRACAEQEAYRTLQKMAMDRKKKLADVARDVILVAEALRPAS